MKFTCLIVTTALMLLCSGNVKSQKNELPRLLVTTDIGGDPDDQQSMIRLMLYSNEFEIEGLIASASGTPGELKEAVVKPHLIEEIVNAYATVEENLRLHSADFPSAADLKSVIKKGNPHRGWENVGEGNDTEGSEWIIQCVDKPGSRPLNIAIWGGQTDLAQALWKVKNTRTEKQYEEFVSKIRVYDIMDQDGIFSKIWESFPGLFYILNKAPEGEDKRNAVFRGMYLGGNEDLTSNEWFSEHVLKNHGPLGKLYPTKTWTAPNPHGLMKEGDTPSWFFFLENGLNCPAHPEYGGWGGRFAKNETGYYADATDSFNGESNARVTVMRWRDDFQHEFAARMDWCVMNFENANHTPVVVVNEHDKVEPLVIRKKPGKKIKLDASDSSDADGDKLTFEWMIYPEGENFAGDLNLKLQGKKAEFVMPRLDENSAIHLVLKATDNGTPKLTGYKRIILINGK